MNERRPSGATAAGWILLVMALFGLGTNASALLAYALALPASESVWVMRVPWKYYPSLASAQVLFALVALGCGVGVLRRMPWTRAASQVVMVVWSAGLVGFGVWMTTWLPTPTRGWELPFGLLWKGLSPVIGAACAAPLLVGAWMLGRQPVRQWFAHSVPDPEPS